MISWEFSTNIFFANRCALKQVAWFSRHEIENEHKIFDSIEKHYVNSCI